MFQQNKKIQLFLLYNVLIETRSLMVQSVWKCNNCSWRNKTINQGELINTYPCMISCLKKFFRVTNLNYFYEPFVMFFEWWIEFSPIIFAQEKEPWLTRYRPDFLALHFESNSALFKLWCILCRSMFGLKNCILKISSLS